MRIVVLALALTVTSAANARADDAGERTNHRRLVHAAAIALGGAAYLTIQFGLADKLAPDTCTWCDPPGIDVSVRDAVRWDDPKLANTFADITGYYGAAAFAVGSVVLSGFDQGPRRWFDDAFPVLESAIASSLLHHLAKFSLPRERPAHHFGGIEVEPAKDQEFSFFSGHSSLSFSLAVSAGMVAHYRHYRSEPYIWAGGLALAAATGYLRIAADAHYFTDVLIGAAVGTAVGYLVPTYLHRDIFAREHATVVPTANGVAISGVF
jgi:membrane-associated phospholipid phosphatase